MTPLVPGALTAADLPVAELAAARLDGEVFTLAGAWCPVDALDGPETRAGAIAATAPRRAVAEGLTAAWVYGLAPEPTVHRFCVDVSARIGNSPGTGVRLREVRITVDEVLLLAGVPVTTPLRTALDLARWGPGGDVAVLAGLLAYAGLGPDATDARAHTTRLIATQHGISFSRVAETRLHRAFALLAADGRPVGQPSLTR